MTETSREFDFGSLLDNDRQYALYSTNGNNKIASVIKYTKRNVAGSNTILCYLSNGRTIVCNEQGFNKENSSEVLRIVEASIDEQSYKPQTTTNTRADAASGNTTTTTTHSGIGKLNARESIALNVMNGIIAGLDDVMQVSDNMINVIVEKSFRFAQAFLDAANETRISLDENSESIVSSSDEESESGKIYDLLKSVMTSGEETLISAILASKDATKQVEITNLPEVQTVQVTADSVVPRALQADTATTAEHADAADTATNAEHADSADTATTAVTATNADNADTVDTLHVDTSLTEEEYKNLSSAGNDDPDTLYLVTKNES